MMEMPIDRSRPYECRMFQARKYALHRLLMMKRMQGNAEMMERTAKVMASARATIAAKMPGWKLAPEYTREDVMNDFRRVIRRNLFTRGTLP